MSSSKSTLLLQDIVVLLKKNIKYRAIIRMIIKVHMIIIISELFFVMPIIMHLPFLKSEFWDWINAYI